jgi:hypothetical protein
MLCGVHAPFRFLLNHFSYYTSIPLPYGGSIAHFKLVKYMIMYFHLKINVKLKLFVDFIPKLFIIIQKVILCTVIIKLTNTTLVLVTKVFRRFSFNDDSECFYEMRRLISLIIHMLAINLSSRTIINLKKKCKKSRFFDTIND